ncbi:alpha/beta fold hydrolase [Azospirillum picis]|uniref:Pimeloyl-ACP methyl ester carboxylesterase n=1 Tax=Azospirillum picis TaxID=488438 RepID=A0ABU0MMY0_9PROT|nr:alpha/beta hydrolase [Azospirillum picis]MBP2301220.1 pimeloyl-ACP methyl ester carboxylesterase [Azospirillum picis]MDQ0534817.1 pimeloyl-ACP methyl ester carboxylesterase [Azospirillum picis]
MSPPDGAAASAAAGRTVTLTTPDGVRLAVQDWRRPSSGRDVLLIHGFSQSHQCWRRQTGGALAARLRLVTYDNRGHGGSAKPAEAGAYRDPALWADEVRTVIDGMALRRPILVAWSYAGRIVLDYLTRHGDGAIGGLVMVGATSTLAPACVGPAAVLMGAMGHEDRATADAAAADFIDRCTHLPLPAVEAEAMRSHTALTPQEVRRALAGRPADYDATLRALRVPVLAIHGEEDAVIRPAMAEHTVRQAAGAGLRLYPDVGHMPFWEAADRFDAELAAFADACP